MSKAQIDNVEQELYQKRKKIYAREVHGLFAKLRLLAVLVLLGLYYFLPWLTWNGRQAVLFDLPHRKFYIFDVVIWPQDFFYLTLLLIIAAFALFFFTNLAGRLWCGYACPQTVWTEVFMWLERKIVGDRPKQIKMDQAPWSNMEKVLRVGGKHLAWVLFALLTGFTFVGWFSPIADLASRLLQLNLGGWEWFWILFYSFATWGNAGFLREQVCLYMCPYARFQGAMFDRDTLIITYDEARGEQRHRLEKGQTLAGKGDCIDCGICVQACPTGIDIRDGLQYECITCAACIDACDDVMVKIGKPKGLVKYSTENAIEGGKTHVLRPRSLMYGAVLMLFVVAFFYALSTRLPLELNIVRDRMSLYKETNEGLIENVFNIRLMNMDAAAHDFELTVDSNEFSQAELKAETTRITLESGEVDELPVRVLVNPLEIKKRSAEIFFELKATDAPKLKIKEPARFIGPVWQHR